MIPSFVLVCMIASALSGQVPDYITKCKYEDPSLEQCVLNNMPKITPHFKDGIASLHLPPLIPLHIPEINVELNQNLEAKITNVDVYGFDTISIEGFKMKEPNLTITFHIDKMRFEGDYYVNGKLLILSIQSECHCFISAENITIRHSFAFIKEERNGSTYIKFYKNRVNFVLSHFDTDLETLVADQNSGAELKKLFIDNWEEILKDFNPVLSRVFAESIMGMMNAVFASVPLNELFIV